MKILVSGEVGAGKTTLCMNVIERVKDKFSIGGTICPEVIAQGRRGSDAIDLLTGERRIMMRKRDIADFDGILVGSECMVHPEGLELSKNAINRAVSDKDCNLIVIDHIGLLEEDGKGIISESINALNSGKDIIIIVRSSVKDNFLRKYPEYDFHIFDVNEENRNEILEGIVDLLENEAQSQNLDRRG